MPLVTVEYDGFPYLVEEDQLRPDVKVDTLARKYGVAPRFEKFTPVRGDWAMLDSEGLQGMIQSAWTALLGGDDPVVITCGRHCAVATFEEGTPTIHLYEVTHEWRG